MTEVPEAPEQTPAEVTPSTPMVGAAAPHEAVEAAAPHEAVEAAAPHEAVEAAAPHEAVEAAPEVEAISSEPVSEPAAEAVPEPVVEAVPEPVVEPVPEPAPDPVSAAATEAMAPVAAAATPEIATPVHHAARKRRRWPWITALSILVVLLLVVVAGLWLFSGKVASAMTSHDNDVPFPVTILSADGGTVTYSGDAGGANDQGLAGIATIEGGYVQTSTPSTVGTGDTATTTRTVTKDVLPPQLAAGQAAVRDGGYFPRNPQVGLGVEYQDVTYDSPAGPTPAWYIPGTSSTWVIYVHGRATTPLEGLRIASTVTAKGYPMLLIKYRDDDKAPVEDGRVNFGATEWPDLQAAVQYALDHGATKVVLTGGSTGGAIVLAFLENSALADHVVGAFLDSPATDVQQMVRKGGRDMGLPDVAISAAMQVASWRYGIDWAATDYVARAKDFTTPMLIVQGTNDTTAPPAMNQEFVAATTPGVATLELFDGAGHLLSWNVDRPRYEGLLSDFLAKVAPPA